MTKVHDAADAAEDLAPDRRICPHCDSGDTEAVIETSAGWGCYCNGCGRTFSVAKTTAEKEEEREWGIDL